MIAVCPYTLDSKVLKSAGRYGQGTIQDAFKAQGLAVSRMSEDCDPFFSFDAAWMHVGDANRPDHQCIKLWTELPLLCALQNCEGNANQPLEQPTVSHIQLKAL